MSDPLTQDAVSSPAPDTQPEPQTPQADLNALSPDQYSKWRETGELPGAEANEEEPPPSKETPEPEKAETPASGTGAQDGSGKPKGAEQRIPELLRERHELRSELSRLQAEVSEMRTRPAAGEAKSEPTAPKGPPAEPSLNQFESFEEYEKAQRTWIGDMVRWETGKALDAQRQQAILHRSSQIAEQMVQQWTGQMDAARTKYPDWDEVTQAVEGDPPESMVRAMVTSQVGAEIAYYLGKNPEEARKIMNMDPVSQTRALGRLEERLEAKTQKPVVPQAKQGAKPPLPDPPTTLGSGNSAGGDEVEAALASGDVGAYIKAANAREIAAAKRR